MDGIEQLESRISENKILVFWIFILCLFVCCDNKHSQNPRGRITTIAEEYEEQKYYRPDTTVNCFLKLDDDLSISKFIERISIKNIKYVENLRECPVVIFLSADLKEYLLAYQYEGGTKYAFNCFEIGYNKDNEYGKYPHIKTNHMTFQTESKILLGMALDKLIKIKGDRYIRANDFLRKYEIDSDDLFLKRYNMPSYFMEINLKGNFIQKIKFGFGYP